MKREKQLIVGIVVCGGDGGSVGVGAADDAAICGGRAVRTSSRLVA